MTMLSSDEQDLPLHDALLGFTGCIGLALKDICSYGLTIGESYVPFDPDPEDECNQNDVACSQAWVRVMSITPKPGQPEGWGGACAIFLQMELEVGVLRCVEIPERAEAPTATDVLLAAMQSMDDMNAIQTAAVACEVWEQITLGSWTPNGPLGGQYGGVWTFTVEIDPDQCVGFIPPTPGRKCGMWTGHGAPTHVTGALDGDEYVDLDSGEVYLITVT